MLNNCAMLGLSEGMLAEKNWSSEIDSDAIWEILLPS